MMDPHEHAALEQRYQSLYEQTLRIEHDARHKRLPPWQLAPQYPSLCRELESVTLQLSRSHQGRPQLSAGIT
jgi:hypothetical protein